MQRESRVADLNSGGVSVFKVGPKPNPNHHISSYTHVNSQLFQIPAMARLQLSLALFSVSLLLFTSGVFSATFTIVNQCSYTVWPGILSGAGTAPLSFTGFALQSGESTTISVPTSWSGRLWGRTLCAVDSTTGKFTCVTGDCGSGTIECSGGAVPPATLAEFTLNGAGGLDFYDVSLVDGYNLPMLVVPQGGTGGGNCTATGCAVDLNGSCPSELRVTSTSGSESVACKSACGAFGDSQYCCSGAYATPNTCKPTYYSQYFKSACPRAYSYAYDDGTSTFTCASANYVITFCPTRASSQKSTEGQYPEATNVSLVSSGCNLRGCTPSLFTTGFATILAAVWWLWQQH